MGKPVGEKQQVGLKFLTLPVKHLEDGVGGDEEQRVGSHIYLVEVDDDADMPFGADTHCHAVEPARQRSLELVVRACDACQYVVVSQVDVVV